MMDNQEQLIERLTRFYQEARGEVSPTPPAWMPRKQRTTRWLQPVLASIALVAIAVGLAVTFRFVREEANRKVPIVPPASASPSPSPSPSATPSPTASPSATASWVTRHIAVGRVQAMSLDVAAIFALYDPYPATGGIRLARVDRSTGAVTTAGPFPNAWQMARVTAGLWIVAGADQANPPADTQWLTLVDPVALKVKQRLRLPGTPDTGTLSEPQLAAASGVMWLGYGHALYRLDPATGRILLTQNLPGTASSVSIDTSGHRLYVGINPTTPQSDQAIVIELDGGTGAHLASAPTGGAGLGGPQVAAAPDGVWIAYAAGMMGAVEHRGALDLTLLPELPARHANGIHVFVGGGTLWLVDSMAQDVACADLRTGAIAASVNETNPVSFVADASGSYLGSFDGVGFLRPDPTCPH